jgi:hypothetical protein
MHGRLASWLLAIAVISVASWTSGPKRHASHVSGSTVEFRSDAGAAPGAGDQLRVANIKCEMVMDPDDPDPDVIHVRVTRSGSGAGSTLHQVSAGAWQAWSRARRAGAGGSRVAELTCVFELSDPEDEGEATTAGSRTSRPAPRKLQAT